MGRRYTEEELAHTGIDQSIFEVNEGCTDVENDCNAHFNIVLGQLNNFEWNTYAFVKG